MRNYKSMLCLILTLLNLPLLIQAQTTAKSISVNITGEVKVPVTLTPSDVDKMEKTTISSKDKNNIDHIYSGVELSVVLKKAGVTMGEELKGKNLTKYLLVGASDSYQVVFSIPETDPEFSEKKIILANRKDGALLPAEEGPFHIIIEGEKKKPRFIRQVISIQVKYAN